MNRGDDFEMLEGNAPGEVVEALFHRELENHTRKKPFRFNSDLSPEMVWQGGIL